MAIQSNEWRPVLGMEGFYEVSDIGEVRSITRTILRKDGIRKLSRGRVIKPRILPSGHRLIRMSGPQGKVNRLAHRMVLEAFVSPCPGEGVLGLHYDDDPSNNSVENLRWGSRSDNLHDMVRNGRHAAARKTHCKHGHELAGDNVFATPSRPSARRCRACHRTYGARAYAKRKAA